MHKTVLLLASLAAALPALAADPAPPVSIKSTLPLTATPAPNALAPQASLAAQTATTAGETGTPSQPTQVAPVATQDTAIVSIQDEPSNDLWQRLRNGMSLPEMDNDLVHSSEQLYASHPGHMSQTLDRARLYLFHVVEEVDKRHMPMEIALLPIVESSYNPQAQSPSAASGIWQFLPSTGKLFGLKQNDWYDGRRDVVTATDAALDYLERLYGMFGDWELALAAYNCGEGCIGRAIAQNRARGLATDFLSLNLPPQTRNYVPRLLAVRNIIRDPAQFGITLEDIPNAPTFKKVTLSFPIEAQTAAKMAQMNMDDFLALNPGFRRRVIYAESQNTLLLPPEKVDIFQKNLDDTESRDIRLHTFHAPKGALLSRIADHFDVTVKWLEDHNPLSTKRGKLVTAQTLILPPTAHMASASPAQLVPPPEPETRHAASGKKHIAKHEHVRIHTVRKGDTLYSLARHYKVRVADILQLNGSLKNLKPGARIQIPENG